MHHSLGTSWFGAKTAVAVALVVVAVVAFGQEVGAQDNCKVECYPNLKQINGKGGSSKGDNCRWILRTDGKAARLCDHIKCRKVCPNNQGASAAAAQDQQSAASEGSRIEQQTEAESPNSATGGNDQPMGIMRKLHSNKIAQAPVPGVAGGRLQQQQQQQPKQQQQAQSTGGRRMAPTLPPAVQYDENDTPPPISRFLDISPEE